MGVLNEILKENSRDAEIKAQKSRFEKMCDVSTVKTTDETFDAELQTYGEMENVSIGSDVKTYYGQTNNIISQAKQSITSSAMTMKQKLSSIKTYQSYQEQSKTSMDDLNRQIREAKKRLNKTMPFSQEAKQAKECYNNLRRQRVKAYLSQRKYRTKTQELQSELREQSESVKQNRTKIEEATKKRKQIIASVRSQFKVIDRIRAQFTFLKTVADLNALSPQAQSQRKSFTDAYSDKKSVLKISILSPLKFYTPKELSDDQTEINPLVAESQKCEEALSGLNLPTLMPPGQKTIGQGIKETQKLIEDTISKKVKQLEALRNGTLPLPNLDPVR